MIFYIIQGPSGPMGPPGMPGKDGKDVSMILFIKEKRF